MIAYIKIWSRLESPTRRIEHHAVYLFHPDTEEEQTAYNRAADVIRKYATARWAVSIVCHGPCAALPAICDTRSRDAMGQHAKPRGAWKEVLRKIHAKEPEVAQRDTLIEMAENGYVLETYPGRFALTDAGEWALGLKKPMVAEENVA